MTQFRDFRSTKDGELYWEVVQVVAPSCEYALNKYYIIGALFLYLFYRE